jgi:thioredoxin reductase (NADPH)
MAAQATPGETPYPQQVAPGAAACDADDTHDAIIVGGGPAGLSAAIYLSRFNRSVLVIDFGEGRSTSHETNENYLGFPEGVRARDLRRLGQEQAMRFGAQFVTGCVSHAAREGDGFAVECDGSRLRARTLIVATGVVDTFPEIPDVEEYVGRSLFWCITCDGWKTRGKRVVVVGKDDEAATTCLQFQNFTDRLTLLTNCDAADVALGERSRRNLAAAGIGIIEGCISHVEGDAGMMHAVLLADGRRIELDVMINQQGSTPNSALVAELGAPISDDGYVTVDEEQRTSVPHLYAAGDITRVFAHQIATAVHEGATAAEAANYDLYRPEQREA